MNKTYKTCCQYTIRYTSEDPSVASFRTGCAADTYRTSVIRTKKDGARFEFGFIFVKKIANVQVGSISFMKIRSQSHELFKSM